MWPTRWPPAALLPRQPDCRRYSSGARRSGRSHSRPAGHWTAKPDYLSPAAERLLTPTSARPRRRRRGAAARLFAQLSAAGTAGRVSTPKSPPCMATPPRWSFCAKPARRPSLTGLGRLIEAQLPGLGAGTAGGRRRGAHPGAKSRQAAECVPLQALQLPLESVFWHCPACGEWESFTPIAPKPNKRG